MHSPSRLEPIIYILVVNKLATLKELKEYYTIDEALDLYDAYMVNLYNKNQANLYRSKNGGKQR